MLRERRSMSLMCGMFDVTEKQLNEHRNRHMSALVAYSPIGAEDLVNSLARMKAMLELRLGREDLDDLTVVKYVQTSVMVIKEIRAITGAKMLSDPKDAIAFWNQIQEAITEALEHHPEARTAVDNAIRRLESQKN